MRKMRRVAMRRIGVGVVKVPFTKIRRLWEMGGCAVRISGFCMIKVILRQGGKLRNPSSISTVEPLNLDVKSHESQGIIGR